MAASAKVFITRLAGLPVIDPSGDNVGRLRDVVVITRPGRQPPRVLGLLVEIQHRRRIFVPIGRVTSIDAAAIVLATGTVNLKRFEQRSVEQLVLGELLDRRVTITETGATVVVVDAAMEQARNRDWEITRLAVREPGGRLGRRGQLRQCSWDEIAGMPVAETDQGAEHLLTVLATMRPPDVAATLSDMPAKRRGEVAAALDDDRLADVLEELDEDDQVSILSALPEDRAADVLEAMDPDDAADLLAELPEGDRDRLLALMEPEEAAPVRRLMIYADDVAGGLMTSEPLILSPDATVAEALARVRNPDLSPALASQVFVCRPPSDTPTGRYLGAAHTQRLLREPPSALVSGVVDRDLEPLRPDTPLTEVTRMLATYNLVAAAVVDDSDRLVGAVTVDDILDALLPEGWRDRRSDA
ncbi:MAG: magnesium transporter MgtE N-terminal domain-containing protein [Mycobacteriales bacterium]|nr:MAG: magnesium transporter [Pseudonocardiales bacterium]